MSKTERINLLGFNGPALTEWVESWGNKPFRARQLMRWIHQHGEDTFDSMTDLARTFRHELAERCVIQAPPVSSEQVSSDGTTKWLFDVGNNNAIETVFIPEDDRGTLCISSQAGCTVGCPFCSTGYQGFNRNLGTAEIVAQLWYAKRVLEADPKRARMAKPSNGAPARAISNVVMMGMGEPLLNYDNVVAALQLMLDDHAYGLSRRRVTVSTSGVVPMIERLAHDCPVALAVSLHAPNDELRDKLVPLNRKHPLAELLESCRYYLQYAPRDFVTFEYVMLDGINDSDEHARQLIDIARSVRCKLNLIPFNPFPQSGLASSSPERIQQFAARLLDAGIVTTTRKTRGDDIAAACGQLAGEVKDRTRIDERLPNRGTIILKEVE